MRICLILFLTKNFRTKGDNKLNMQLSENDTLFNDYDDIVTIDDIMKMLHIGRTAVYKLLQDKTIKSVKVGKKYIIPKASVIDFVTLN